MGSGDGGANEDSLSQWCTGSALARQVDDLRRLGAGGWALYRYDSLFRPAQPEPAAAERAALAALTVGSGLVWKIKMRYTIAIVQKQCFEDKKS